MTTALSPQPGFPLSCTSREQTVGSAARFFSIFDKWHQKDASRGFTSGSDE